MTVPKGTSAEINHGDEIINKFCDDLVEYLSDEHAA
jgi:regulator of sigma D